MIGLEKAVARAGRNAPAKYASSGRLAWFCYQFAVAFKAGIPVAEAISLIAGDDEYFHEPLGDMAQEIEAGIQLHQALSNRNIFPPYLVSMVKIGERTGTLDKVMAALATYYEHEDNLRNEIKDALTYPLILICMAGAVVLLLTSKILPVFNDILISAGTDMPGIAKTLMNAGLFMSSNLAWLLGGLFAIILAVWAWKSTPAGRKNLARLKAETRLLDGIFLKIYAARISAVMWYVLESGLNAGNALEMAAKVVGNEYIEERITFCRQKIQQGADLAESFDSAGAFPGRFVNMIRAGHKTGELPVMARKMAAIYQDEIDRALQGAVSGIEPALVAVLSIIIGIVLITVMLPLMRIMSSMG